MASELCENSFLIICTVKECINDGDLGITKRCIVILEHHIPEFSTYILRSICAIIKNVEKQEERGNLYQTAAAKIGEENPADIFNPWRSNEEEEIWKGFKRKCQEEIRNRMEKGKRK